MLIFSMHLHVLPRMNAMLDIICMGSVDLQLGTLGKRTEKKNEKFLLTMGLEPTTLRFVVRVSTD